MINKNFITSVILVFITFKTQSLYAQQDAQYTQYMYNTISVNPAYAGSRGQLSMAALYRTQWVGLDGAPKTFTLNLHSPIRNSRLGYGVSVVNDAIGDGTVAETYFDGDVSYTIDVGQDKKLSFGVKIGGKMFNLDYSKLQQRTDGGGTEPSFGDNIDNRFNINFGAGVYYHTSKFYAGLSIPNFLETEHFDNSKQNDDSSPFLSKERLNLYFITGYVFDIGSDLKFKPAFLTKAVQGAPLQLDFSASFMFNNKFTFGAAYRWDAALSGLVGFQINDQLAVGLAYDKETTDLGGTQFNNGSFEIFLRLELVKSFKKLVSPRFF